MMKTSLALNTQQFTKQILHEHPLSFYHHDPIERNLDLLEHLKNLYCIRPIKTLTFNRKQIFALLEKSKAASLMQGNYELDQGKSLKKN